MKLINQLQSLISPDNEEITEEVLDYYENNPDELDLIINKEHFNVLFLGFFFVLGFGLTIVARSIQYSFAQDLGAFFNAVVLDVVSELGIAIFGGAVVAYFIEFLNKQQYQENVKFRNQVKEMIGERKKKRPTSTK